MTRLRNNPNNINNNRRRRGNRRPRLQGPAPLEPRGMAPALVRGPTDPPPTLYAQKLHYRHEFAVNGPAGSTALFAVTDGILCTSLPGAWASFRILKLSIYYPEGSNLTGVLSNSTYFVAAQMSDGINVDDQNSQTFTDHGVPGAQSAALHVRPSFAQRQTWYAYNTSGTNTLFKVAGGPAAGSSNPVTIIIQATLELQGATQTPVYMRGPDD